jgi:hypothetical protein
LRLKYPCLILFFASLATEATAQRPAGSVPITAGSRVRVKTATLVAPLIANFLEQRGDTLVFIEDDRGRGLWSISLSQIERLETTAGESAFDKRPIARNAAIGGAIGLVAGLVFAEVATPSDSTREYSKLLSGALGAGVGAGLGAIIGSRSKTERWVNVPLPRQLSVRPNFRGGYTVVFSFR